MFKLLDWILLPRETRELARLNDIHEAFNDKKITGRRARYLIYSYGWKYHHEKVALLLMFIDMYGKATAN